MGDRNEMMEPDARQRILDATVAAIDHDGEASVRISQIAREAGVTQGMISYYFGGREGLVQEAHLQRFRSSVGRDLQVIEDTIRTISSGDELLEFLRVLTLEIVSETRAASRQTRVMAIGAALPRPALLEGMRSAQTELIAHMERVILIGQARELVRNDVDARAIATFILSYSTGLVVADLDLHRSSTEQLAAAVDVFVAGMIRKH